MKCKNVRAGGQWDALVWSSPGDPELLCLGSQACGGEEDVRGSCTTELYSQDGLYQAFSMQNGT